MTDTILKKLTQYVAEARFCLDTIACMDYEKDVYGQDSSRILQLAQALKIALQDLNSIGNILQNEEGKYCGNLARNCIKEIAEILGAE